MELKEILCEDVDRIHIPEDSIQWRDFKYGNEHYGFIKGMGFRSFLGTRHYGHLGCVAESSPFRYDNQL